MQAVMIVLIFVALAIFVFGLIMQYPEKQTQRQMDLAFFTTMFGMLALFILAIITVVLGWSGTK